MTILTRRAFLSTTIGTAAAATLVATARADGHAANHTVTIQGHAFRPANLTISPGDSVTFVNQDGAPHTATANNGGFDTGRLNRGDSVTLTFASGGNFAYFCAFHRSMTGSVTVA